MVFVHGTPGSLSKVTQAEANRRKRFVDWVSDYYTWTTFDDSTSLVTKVAGALRTHEKQTGHESHETAWQEIITRGSAAADFDCVAVSAHNVDRIYSVDLVAADYETRIGEPIIAAGGSGANTAAGLGRLGLRVAVAGVVASDSDGDLIKRCLAENGAESFLATAPAKTSRTGSTLAFTDSDGRRSIYVNPGINERFASIAKRGPLKKELLQAVRSTRVLHLSSFTRAPERHFQESLLETLPESALLSFTPGALYCTLGLDRLAPLIGRANVLFLYEQQLNDLIEHEVEGEMAAARSSLRERLDRLYSWKSDRGYEQPLAVVVKRSVTGSTTDPQRLRGAVGRTQVEASEPTQASVGVVDGMRDSTGAGDAAATGMLWALLNGQPLNYALDIAYVCSRAAGQEIGGRAGLLTASGLRSNWRRWLDSPHKI